MKQNSTTSFAKSFRVKHYVILIAVIISSLFVWQMSSAQTDTVSATVTATSLAISLTGGTISFGSVALSASTTTVGNGYQQTATNDGSIMKLNVRTSQTTGGSTPWDNQATIATNKYKLEVATTSASNGYMTFQGNDTYLTASSSMPAGNTEILDFRFTAPSSSTEFVEKTMTITVQAAAI